MTLPGSNNPISFGDIRTEYGAGNNQPVSMADYFRGGSIVRDPAANNQAANLSSNVPQSGNPISLGDFYSQEAGFKYTINSNISGSNTDFEDYFGTDWGVNYPKTVKVNSGKKLTNTGNGARTVTLGSGLSGSFTIECDGEIENRGGFCIDNNTGTSITLIGNGNIDSGDVEDWVSSWAGNFTKNVKAVGGQGGASGPDIYHSSYSDNTLSFKLVRSGNTYTLSWTYNECDYANLGSGSKNISSVFPTNSDGTYNASNTSALRYQTTAGANGRDVRDIAAGTKRVSGKRYLWLCSNNKSTDMNSSITSYSQPGHTSVSLSTSNDAGQITQTYTGSRFQGTVSTSGFTGSLN